MVVRIENKKSASWLSWLDGPLVYRSEDIPILITFKKGKKKIVKKSNRIETSCLKTITVDGKVFSPNDYTLLVYLDDEETVLVSQMGNQTRLGVYPNITGFASEETQKSFMKVI